MDNKEQKVSSLNISALMEIGKALAACGAELCRIAEQEAKIWDTEFEQGCPDPTPEEQPTVEEIISVWENYQGRAQELELPSAPKHFLHYFTEPDRPQIKSERNLENGMAVSVGRLREDTQYDYKFVCMSHNTLRGAAGGAVLLAELLCAEGYMD